MPKLGLNISMMTFMEEAAATIAEILWNKITTNWNTENRAWEEIA